MFLNSYQYFQSYATILSKFRCTIKEIIIMPLQCCQPGILLDIFLYPQSVSLPKSEGILSSTVIKNSSFKWENHGVIWNMSLTHQSWQYFNNLKSFLKNCWIYCLKWNLIALVFCDSLDGKPNYRITVVFRSSFSFFLLALCSYLYFSLKLFLFPIPMLRNAKLNSNKEICGKMVMRIYTKISLPILA